jgi:3-deoxy-D-manno-octulosonic-acid transferase
VSLIFSWLLNVGYLALIAVASPWIAWAAWRQGKYREGFAEKLLGRVPRRVGSRPCVWLHAVSVGEVNLLATTIAEIARRHLDWELVISTTTKAGYDLARRKYADRAVFYCPLDFTWAVRAALRRVRPDVLVLAELELWPNLIRAAKAHGARVAIINGRLSDHSFRGYRRLRPLVRRVLRQIDLAAAQNEETAERFRQLGADPAAVAATGSLKFDGAQTDRQNPKTRELRELAGFAEEAVVLLAGSTQEPEETYALDIFRRLSAAHPKLRLVLVPRHPQRFDEVARLLDESGLSYVRRSQLAESAISSTLSSEPKGRNPQSEILLVDTIGELGAWWGAATIGFVGGSLGSRGGQNMLEPAAYGVATCFGPNTWNFRDIVAQLLAAEAAVVVQDRHELDGFVRRALDDPAWAEALGQRARQLVLSQQGATARTVDLLTPLVADSESKSRRAA